MTNNMARYRPIDDFESELGIGTDISVEAFKEMAANPTMDFVKRANCRGQDVNRFFPERGREFPADLRKLCRTCDVRMECLAWGIAHERRGHWGGASARIRNSVAHKHRIAISEPESSFMVELTQIRIQGARVRAANAAAAKDQDVAS